MAAVSAVERRLAKANANNLICGSGSVVERRLAKANVASSNLVFRSIIETERFLFFRLKTRFNVLANILCFCAKELATMSLSDAQTEVFR